jgi:hypothetical protein
MHARNLLFAVWGLLTLGPGGAAAGEVVTLAQPDAEFAETLGGRAKVSGRVLVGLRIGPSPGRFDAGRVRVALPPASEALPLCVRITSSDGRYWALNPYLARPPLPPTPRLDIRTKYQDQLADYDGDDIIIRVADSGQCHEDAEGLIRPFLYAHDGRAPDGATRLHAYVNTGSARATLELLGPAGQSLGTTKCTKPSNRAAVSFTRLCALDLPPALAPGRYQLLITARALTGSRVPHRFDIWLPE